MLISILMCDWHWDFCMPSGFVYFPGIEIRLTINVRKPETWKTINVRSPLVLWYIVRITAESSCLQFKQIIGGLNPVLAASLAKYHHFGGSFATWCPMRGRVQELDIFSALVSEPFKMCSLVAGLYGGSFNSLLLSFFSWNLLMSPDVSFIMSTFYVITKS